MQQPHSIAVERDSERTRELTGTEVLGLVQKQGPISEAGADERPAGSLEPVSCGTESGSSPGRARGLAELQSCSEPLSRQHVPWGVLRILWGQDRQGGPQRMRRANKASQCKWEKEGHRGSFPPVGTCRPCGMEAGTAGEGSPGGVCSLLDGGTADIYWASSLSSLTGRLATGHSGSRAHSPRPQLLVLQGNWGPVELGWRDPAEPSCLGPRGMSRSQGSVEAWSTEGYSASAGRVTHGAPMMLALLASAPDVPAQGPQAPPARPPAGGDPSPGRVPGFRPEELLLSFHYKPEPLQGPSEQPRPQAVHGLLLPVPEELSSGGPHPPCLLPPPHSQARHTPPTPPIPNPQGLPPRAHPPCSPSAILLA
ncbi:basic salivary proline-rich protein 3-like [Choloepus didactylus]|uniref:basic salivary proline-rich protein 3-like n=1 Tax=Choloepus didactylus TaxID=27675 RepID=UPI0018A077E9|nr:basic salivary proline-rich protein 3-like [Choloepus didactylus]